MTLHLDGVYICQYYSKILASETDLPIDNNDDLVSLYCWQLFAMGKINNGT